MRFSLATIAVCSLLLLTSELATGAPTAVEGQIPPALAEPGLLHITYDKYPRITRNEPVSRSPCPFLNSAANHGVLPYSGKGIKLTWLKTLLNKVGLSDRAAKPFIDGMDKVIAEAKKKNPAHGDDYIDLSDLNAHNIIEHDGSLTRHDILDAATADLDAAAKADPKLIGGMFSHITNIGGGKDTTKGLPEVTYSGIASWRKQRLEQEGKRHKINYHTSKAVILGSGECALLLEVLGNGSISGKDANSFLAKETFPDGWQAHELSLPKLLATMARCGLDSALVPDFVLGWVTKWNAGSIDSQKTGFGKVWGWAFGNKEEPAASK